MIITYSKSKDQPGKVANPARGQLNREIEYECFNDWGGWGYDDCVPGEVTKTTHSGDRTT